MNRDDTDALTLVRTHVKDLLTRSPAFRQLPPGPRDEMEADLTQVAAYLAVPEGIRTTTIAGAVAIVPYGGASTTNVDFPSFVGNLIRGTFQAIVEASIQQMDAYARLLENAAETVSGFLRDRVSDDGARRFLAATWPDYFDLDPNPECQKLRPRDHLNRAEALRRLSLLPLEAPIRILDQQEIDGLVVPAAARRLHASRQQLLASMVLMGFNQAVVTHGNAPAA